MTGRRQRINVQNHCPCPWPFYRTSNSRAPWGGQCGLCCDCITTQHLPDTCSSPKLSQQSSHTGMLFQGLFFRILICNHPYSSFWPVVLEKTLESPLDCKDIKPVNLKGNQPWIFIGRTDAEAEALILWLLDAKSRLIRKEPDSGKDWWQEEKETTEDERVGWHHQLNRHELEQALGDCEGQGSLVLQRVGHDWATEQQPASKMGWVLGLSDLVNKNAGIPVKCEF